MMSNPAYETESWDIPVEEFEWRLMRTWTSGEGESKGIYVAYPDARTVADHLDRLFGAAGWTDEYVVYTHEKAVVCTLRVNLGGVWVSKTDAGVMSDIEPVKGGFSDAFKRAAAKLGVGRNAYAIPEIWGPVVERGGKFYMPKKDSQDRPFAQFLVDQALGNAVAAPEKKAGAKPKEAKKEVAPAEAPVETSDQAELLPDAEWKKLASAMKSLSEVSKSKAASWWAENGDGTSKPSRNTDAASLRKFITQVNVINAEAELDLVEPF